MKIWTLVENTSAKETVLSEHGLSFYVETGNKRILFDMGQSNAFAKNAEMLGIDLSQVDFAVLSHGHYDHGGGLETFLEINKTAPVYVSPYAFGDYRNASGKYIGLDRKLKDCPRLIPVEARISLGEGITLDPCTGQSRVYPLDSAGLQKLQKGRLTDDDFLHEQYLLVEEKGKRICFSGCSHRGILNIAHWLESDVYIGGFHFMKEPPDSRRVLFAAKELAEKNACFYTCHCTGKLPYESLKAIMGKKLESLSAGDCLEIGEK